MGLLKSYRAMTGNLWPKVRQVRRSDYKLIRSIRTRSRQLESLNFTSFTETAEELRQRLRCGLDVLDTQAIIEAFAISAEALRRTTGKVFYDCQLLGGLVLATGSIAEMQTGEGKTITCALPAVLYGLKGDGVHVATTNAYLAERDHAELAPIFELTGISSAIIKSDQSPMSKRSAYAADVTYGTGYEFGFDFLRDQLTLRNQPAFPLGTRFLGRLRGLDPAVPQLVQRRLSFAIIDEADSVLIDEATTPLILSGTGKTARPSKVVYAHAMKVADTLKEREHFTVDESKGSLELTKQGWATTHHLLDENVQCQLQRPWAQYVEQSLRAAHLLQREVDYVVMNDEIVIVDQNTGRIHDERKWRSGLHQSVEIREGVPLTAEREIEARITRQRYFKFYDRIAGMTGTAVGNEQELLEFYHLPVVQIPRNQPTKRVRLPSFYCKTTEEKFAAIVESVIRKSLQGQPVLVGTKSIYQSLEISKLLNEKGVQHSVLNGTQDEAEAEIISQAGISGSVTIATNMAGRGTDIRLDSRAIESGGIHVIAVEHHESPRVDRQLIGRAARQSDPGSCQFFVCSEDEIILHYHKSFAKTLAKKTPPNNHSPHYDRSVRELQSHIEKLKFASRQKMVLHDNWIESVQRAVAKLA